MEQPEYLSLSRKHLYFVKQAYWKIRSFIFYRLIACSIWSVCDWLHKENGECLSAHTCDGECWISKFGNVFEDIGLGAKKYKE